MTTIFKDKSSYRSAWANAYHKDPEIPLNVDIELASTCNLACPFCFWGEAKFNHEMQQPAQDGKAKKRLMPEDMAWKIITEAAAYGVPSIKLNWRGESTLHPKYSSIIRFARERDTFHDIMANTNANCKDHALDGLMLTTKLVISLDSLVPETYAKMRVNGNLDRAIEVTRHLIRAKHPNLWIRRVITRENQHEQFERMVRQIFGPGDYHVSEHFVVDRSKDTSHEVNNPENYERTYCGYPSQRIMVAADGLCYPCCVDTDATMPMGDFTKNSLSQIWNNDKFTNLRKELRSNVFKSDICRNCESWMAYKAPQRENVQDEK